MFFSLFIFLISEHSKSIDQILYTEEEEEEEEENVILSHDTGILASEAEGNSGSSRINKI